MGQILTVFYGLLQKTFILKSELDLTPLYFQESWWLKRALNQFKFQYFHYKFQFFYLAKTFRAGKIQNWKTKNAQRRVPAKIVLETFERHHIGSSRRIKTKTSRTNLIAELETKKINKVLKIFVLVKHLLSFDNNSN